MLIWSKYGDLGKWGKQHNWDKYYRIIQQRPYRDGRTNEDQTLKVMVRKHDLIYFQNKFTVSYPSIYAHKAIVHAMKLSS